jgi:peptidoglycan/xylan/chitin deacetylase (PgdA/CDA1 family)
MTQYKNYLFALMACVLISSSHSVLAARHAVVVQYQHISERTPPSKSASEAAFIKHLDYLKANGFTVWPLEKIVSRVQRKQALPDKTIAITFDHAYISVYQNALKHLSARKLPFTVFVAAEPIIKEHPLYMNWQQLREVQKAGGTIGSMGITGSNFAKSQTNELPKQRQARLEKEIDLNQTALRKYLAVTPTLLAYPDGEADEVARKVVKSKGLIGFGLHQGPVSRYTSLTYLPRFTATDMASNITNLSVKLSSLPLPVRRIKTQPSILAADNRRPQAEVELLSGSYQLSGLRCNDSKGLPVDTYISEGGSRPKFVMKSEVDEDIGPIEYTCSAPHDKSSRFYWFSHTWILPNQKGTW